MIYVDASALVAMIAVEADAARVFEEMAAHETRITSPLAVFEAVLAIRRLNLIAIDEALALLDSFAVEHAIEVVPIERADSVAALSAFGRYGKGEGRPGKLNMGDCFAYGMAGRRGHRLLYKGTDFAETDLGRA
jgi:ribonuclease VapC